MEILKISNLSVQVLEKKIINNLSLKINTGEIHVLMGRNGSGKSTLVNALMGNTDYSVTSGSINFLGKDIQKLPTDERAKMGIYLAMQNPPVIEGLSTAELLRNNLSSRTDNFKLFNFVQELEAKASHLGINQEMLHRSINDGFSGGERKKNEILQLELLKPSLIILDEIDSGVDVDSLKLIADVLINYRNLYPETAILMITHHANFFKYLEPDFVHIINEGNLVESGGLELVHQIEKQGFSKTINCLTKDILNE